MISTSEIINFKLGQNVYLKPEYLLSQQLSGNKFRKLKYNIIEAQKNQFDTLLTFGGAYSNHILAVAYLGKAYGLKTIGVIRGEELKHEIKANPTLKEAQSCGMQFEFMSRPDYKNKYNSEVMDQLEEIHGQFYMLPEGGTNTLAVKGCEEILTQDDASFDYICCPVGTGGTISGIINSSFPNQKILGFPALKGDFLKADIAKFAKKDNWDLVTDYHFGGYAKINNELISFMNEFKVKYDIQLDPVYTGKMMFGIMDMIKNERLPRSARILAIHTGGLQGIRGMNLRLQEKNLPLIQ